MLAIGYLLVGLAGIGSLVCWIMVLVKMFQNEKPLLGVLGILCGLWAFIWGWMNATKLNIKKLMLIWTACFVVSLIANGLVVANAPKMVTPEGGSFQIETP